MEEGFPADELLNWEKFLIKRYKQAKQERDMKEALKLEETRRRLQNDLGLSDDPPSNVKPSSSASSSSDVDDDERRRRSKHKPHERKTRHEKRMEGKGESEDDDFEAMFKV